MEAGFLLVHVSVTAAWLGAMLYSLLVVQPRAERFFSDHREREDFAVLLATGARWPVLALVGALGASGAGLVVLELKGNEEPTAAWLGLVTAKGILLVAALALFVEVSWRLWPARLFAHVSGSDELARLQRRFRRVSLALTVTIAAGLVLGVVADVVR
jgi:uncharacterized membrane protein